MSPEPLDRSRLAAHARFWAAIGRREFDIWADGVTATGAATLSELLAWGQPGEPTAPPEAPEEPVRPRLEESRLTPAERYLDTLARLQRFHSQ